MKKTTAIIATLIILVFTLAGCFPNNLNQNNNNMGNQIPNEDMSDIDVIPPTNIGQDDNTQDNESNQDGNNEQLVPPTTGSDQNTTPAPQPPITETIPKPPITPPQPIIQYDTLVMSNVDGINIRKSPSNSGAVIGNINKGDMVSYLGKSGDWYITTYKQSVAYISANSKYTTLKTFAKASNKIESIIEVGKTLMGYPYVWGSQRYHWGSGNLNSNFVQGEYDCSALMQYMFYIGGGIKLDLTSRSQYVQGDIINVSDLQRGDLMFFTNSSRKNLSGVERVGHVGIYLGNNYILHTASDYAVIEPISSTRWGYFLRANRFV